MRAVLAIAAAGALLAATAHAQEFLFPVQTPSFLPAAYPARVARVRSHAAGSGLFSLVTSSAIRHGVPPHLAHAIVRIESGYRCGARSRAGALGIMQILPRSAAGVGVRGNLLDCATGLEAGMRYLRKAIAVGGAGCVGASLYNVGIAGARRCTAYGRQAMALSRDAVE